MWLMYAGGAVFVCAGISLLFRWLGERSQPLAVTIFVFKSVATACVLIELVVRSERVDLTPTDLLLLLSTGILSNLGDIGQLRAITFAPNPGYALGVIFIYPLLVVLAAMFIPGLSSPIGSGAVTGALLCSVGTILLAWPEGHPPRRCGSLGL